MADSEEGTENVSDEVVSLRDEVHSTIKQAEVYRDSLTRAREEQQRHEAAALASAEKLKEARKKLADAFRSLKILEYEANEMEKMKKDYTKKKYTLPEEEQKRLREMIHERIEEHNAKVSLVVSKKRELLLEMDTQKQKKLEEEEESKKFCKEAAEYESWLLSTNSSMMVLLQRMIQASDEREEKASQLEIQARALRDENKKEAGLRAILTQSIADCSSFLSKPQNKPNGGSVTSVPSASETPSNENLEVSDLPETSLPESS